MGKEYFVYILECSDNSFYTGITSDINKRVEEHNSGVDTKCYTYRRRPVKLVFSQKFDSPIPAIEAEKRIKGWSRAKKIALIKNDWDEIVRLSNSLGKQCHSELVEE